MLQPEGVGEARDVGRHVGDGVRAGGAAASPGVARVHQEAAEGAGEAVGDGAPPAAIAPEPGHEEHGPPPGLAALDVGDLDSTYAYCVHRRPLALEPAAARSETSLMLPPLR